MKNNNFHSVSPIISYSCPSLVEAGKSCWEVDVEVEKRGCNKTKEEVVYSLELFFLPYI